MRTTRRIIDADRTAAALALIASLSALSAMTASCPSSEGDALPVDGGGDTQTDAGADAVNEDVTDAGPVDAALVDAAPLTITCDAPPCAIALTTTLPSDGSSRDEGYCAILTDGTVACWGTNKSGQLGDPAFTEPDSPIAVRVPGLSKVTALDHTCAVDEEGAAWCWGSGPFLQSEAATATVEASPVRLPLPGPASKLAIESTVGCAILRDASVLCWGTNGRQQVSAEPEMYGKRNELPHPIPLAAGARDIAVGNATFALHDDGRVSSWGALPALGRPSAIPADGSPARIALEHVTSVVTTGAEACAVANGVGWCWGPPDVLSSLSPSPYIRALPTAIDTPEPITRIATTASRSVSQSTQSVFEKRRWCAVGVSGDVYCWGLNNAGQAGDGTNDYALGTVRVTGLPAPAAEVKVMPYSTCAILTNGKVYCWGNNATGQLGAGLPKGSFTAPTEVTLP